MDIRLERGLTLEEALQIAYDDEENTIHPIEAIYIEPPEVNVLTDGESGDEEADFDLDRLSGRQLRSQAEIKLSNNERICSVHYDEEASTSEATTSEATTSEATTSESTTSKATTSTATTSKETISKSINKKEKIVHCWTSGELVNRVDNFVPPCNFSQFEHLSPVETFELFWTDDLLEYIQEECRKYALFKNCPDPKISGDEIKCFLAILILSGYDVKPGKRFYWDSGIDMGNQLVKNSMRRNRFEQIMQFFQLADNTKIDNNDKAWKVRPLMNKLKERFIQHYVPDKDINYDESMVKYFGRHHCKQFIRGKPIRFGFKMWSLNTKGGYLINFDLYQGKNPKAETNDEIRYGKSTAPLLGLLRELSDTKRKLPYKLFIDNLFTSIYLLQDMRDVGIWCTGTVRENRVPKEITIPSKKQLATANRGDYYSAIDRTTGIVFVRWVDNSIVTVASTCFGVQPFTNVKCYSKQEKKVVQVPQPNLIRKYNVSMGGTDLMDQNVSRYRVSVRSKKWWWCLFTWMLDVSIQNAWYIHTNTGKSTRQLEFRRDIVTNYLVKYGTKSKGAGRPSAATSSQTESRVSDDVRFDRTDHLLVFIPNNKRRRCAKKECNSIIRTMCVKCDIGLCIACNENFHSK